jgi:hypothetical protein
MVDRHLKGLGRDGLLNHLLDGVDGIGRKILLPTLRPNLRRDAFDNTESVLDCLGLGNLLSFYGCSADGANLSIARRAHALHRLDLKSADHSQ